MKESTRARMMVQNLNIQSQQPFVAPSLVANEFPLTEKLAQSITAHREAFMAIMRGDDTRFVIVHGPCSVHNREGFLEYARRSAALQQKVGDKIFLMTRMYGAKPRTTSGWEGIVFDPEGNGSHDRNKGVRLFRDMALHATEMGIALATEVLDQFTINYFIDLMTWSAIGARTTTAPLYRHIASGLSTPVGFKNPESGSIVAVMNAMITAQVSNTFGGMDDDGFASIVTTKGNRYTHLVMRGSEHGPNYEADQVDAAIHSLMTNGHNLYPSVLVDCSHANSGKDFRKQRAVFDNVLEQRLAGNASVTGVMIEANIKEGAQKMDKGLVATDPFVSVTDSCIGWEELESIVLSAHARLP